MSSKVQLLPLVYALAMISIFWAFPKLKVLLRLCYRGLLHVINVVCFIFHFLSCTYMYVSTRRLYLPLAFQRRRIRSSTDKRKKQQRKTDIFCLFSCRWIRWVSSKVLCSLYSLVYGLHTAKAMCYPWYIRLYTSHSLFFFSECVLLTRKILIFSLLPWKFRN
jgi:hypothetical protein